MSPSATPTRRVAALGALAAACALIAISATPAAAVVTYSDLNYDIDSPPAPAPANQNYLDLYLPDGTTPSDSRPVVVYVHGGGWARGDKQSNVVNKIPLFTGAGYVFASLNYRLSPDIGEPEGEAVREPLPFDPGRIKFPDHPHDVGEAIGWLDRNVGSYGGDPGRIVLIGHSAGAHLVDLIAADPSYDAAYGVEPGQIAGVVSLDTATVRVSDEADPAGPAPGPEQVFWNAFGTPAENEATGSWAAGSPINFADPGDPEYLFITQQASAYLQSENAQMAVALGQDPASSVLAVPLDHVGINDALGDPADASGETVAVMEFVRRVLPEVVGPAVLGPEALEPRVTLGRHPRKLVRVGGRRAEVRFRFSSSVAGSAFECRLGAGKLKPCRSPRSYRVGLGRHRFRVRAIAPSGQPGPAKSFRFRVARR